MEFDFKAEPSSWVQAASLARQLEAGGFSGVLYTEGAHVPWMMIASASQAAPSLSFMTGVAVAFPRSPMMTAQIAWEMASNTQGRFRMGLGSQVKAHVTRRYSAPFDKPAPQMRDYLEAVRACLSAFKGDAPLQHQGPYYALNLLPSNWIPAAHEFTDIKLDISAVGPYMCRLAGELADGLHVHPMHSMTYIDKHLLPQLSIGAKRAGRKVDDIDLIVPVFAIAGDSEEERAQMLQRAKMRIAFYGTTPNYSFQFDDLGYGEVPSKLREAMRKGDNETMLALITDEIFDHFGIVARWDDLADKLIGRYRGTAQRLVSYMTAQSLADDEMNLGKWCEIARAVRAAPRS